MPDALMSTLNTVPLNTFNGDVLDSFEITIAGKAHNLRTYTAVLPGIGNVVYERQSLAVPGAHQLINTFDMALPGMGNVAIIKVVVDVAGASANYSTYTPALVGAAHVRDEYCQALMGFARAYREAVIDVPGASQCGLGLIAALVGCHAVNQSIYTRAYRQGYRVADLSLETLELYAGYGEMPDFEDAAQPVATGDPINWTPAYPGAGQTTVLHLVTKKRNRYGLVSFNQSPTLIEIDENGDAVLGPLSSPELVKVLDGTDVGSIQVWVRYAYEVDRNPADTWELYVKAGASPVIGVDSPALIASMGGVGNNGIPWRGVVSDLIPGVTYYIRAAVRRAEDDAYTQTGVRDHTVAAVYKVDVNEFVVFAGDEHELQ